ncbi:metallophosphoesterase, partial [Bradyrhizobium sp. NBAIM08]|uniref:metallophosphoesterase n=1 Tax=Bradyrhizobium sp. NBAIM08 TaxID=2793815 RepID=UPI001CD71084
TNEIVILHISDLHFGSNHICRPEDPTASSAGIPGLKELLLNDFLNIDPITKDDTDYSAKKDAPVIAAITGDFTQRASHDEFQEAIAFLNQLEVSSILGQKLSKNDIFMVPGNHDVQFDKRTSEERFQPYCSFYNKYFGAE